MVETSEERNKPSFGQALDAIIETLKAFDANQQQTLIATVCDLLRIRPRNEPKSDGAVPVLTTVSIAPGTTETRRGRSTDETTDIRTLKEQKRPKSAAQMAAVVAYYLKEIAPDGERQDTIKTEDLETYFKQARFELPKKLEQLLADSKRAGYFEQVTRGEYRLTRVGHNLVAHRLPGTES